ncbi:hypothetical protein UFOVP965_82 [uncultured Caudovirales phage]|uniref:Uncharacterized protein n=1 Tax=uncultured Caudovirales phage TaxID=2100421 RepID=A0A6J5QFF8_9CAUD|nr:hypothetical protein UFOVP965_82 [uncultured Caudovirales phage]CAB4179845.1 hypothetical protein UFOVP1035_78 [uncultured Caudovirales phage]CAB4188582.1 hypothetical protein UFOVP1181_37 [uncultured Caudovirales phage]
MAEDFESERFNLLICKTCQTIEELPYTKTGEYMGEGKYKQDDNPYVDAAARKHGPDHVGAPLVDVLQGHWMTPKVKAGVVEQLRETFFGRGAAQGLDVFGTNFYGLKDTYSQDAMSCWKIHNSPKGQCPDYKVDRKLLSAGTEKERAAEGLNKSTIRVFLCDFCPVKMYNQKRAYEEQGLYD